MKSIILSLICVLSLTVSCFAQENKTNIYASNIIIVFDASGSMGDPIGNGDRSIKIDAAKIALKQVVTRLKENTNVGLFVFGNVRNDNPVPISPKNATALNTAIDRINEGGGTPLGEYLKKAADQLLEQRQKNLGYGSYKILVVTDGEATDGGKMEKVAPEIVKRGISLDVIGVGMTGEHRLAKMSTSYRAANDTKALNRALQEVTAETSNIVNAADGLTDDFAIINQITNEQAVAILTSLGNTENQPIGEKPKVVETTKSLPTDTIISTTSTQSCNIWFIIIPVVLVLIVILSIIFASTR